MGRCCGPLDRCWKWMMMMRGRGFNGDVVAALWTADGVFEVLEVNLLDAGHLPRTKHINCFERFSE